MFETASHIKRRSKTRDIPIIFLTAADSERDYAFLGYAGRPRRAGIRS